MANPTATRPNEINRVPLGDRGWLGVNMRLDPAVLPAGYAAKAINMRFTAAIPESRKGSVVMPWLCKIVGTAVQPWGTIYGRGNFSDPLTLRRYTVVAADGNVYLCLPNNTPVQMELPVGVSITSTVRFTQCFDRLIMHRGFALPTLELPAIGQAWRVVVQTPSGDGTRPIPNAERGLFMADRLFVLEPDDAIAVSDIGDFTRYVPQIQEFLITQGSADDLIAIAKLGENTLIAFKDQSVHAVYNVFGELNDLRQDQLTDEFGIVAPDAVARVGNEIWFLSQIGLVAIEATAEGTLRIKTRVNANGERVPVRISEPLQPLFDRIQWQYVSSARAVALGEHYYLALPIDRAEVVGPELVPYLFTVGTTTVIAVESGKTYRWTKNTDTNLINGVTTYTQSTDFTAAGSTVTLTRPLNTAPTSSLTRVDKGVNNAIAVYNRENGAWSGWDEATGLAVREMWKDIYLGRGRLFIYDAGGYGLLYEEDEEDHLPQPYLDLEIIAAPLVGGGDSFRVNGGSTIIVNTFQDGSNMIDESLANARNNLWVDSGNAAGYYPAAVIPWTAANTQRVKISTGVRFYATNGVAPVATIVGTAFQATTVKTQAIATTFITRAYAPQTSSRVRGRQLAMSWQTRKPTISVASIKPGANERMTLLSGYTRDRTKYTRPAHRVDFDPSNTSGDFKDPYREDYSHVFGAGATESDNLFLHTSAGVPLDLVQEDRYNRRLTPDQDRALQIEITNAAGRVRILSLNIEASDQRGRSGTAN